MHDTQHGMRMSQLCCSVLHVLHVLHVLQDITVCCSALNAGDCRICVAVFGGVLQCVAVCCNMLNVT